MMLHLFRISCFCVLLIFSVGVKAEGGVLTEFEFKQLSAINKLLEKSQLESAKKQLIALQNKTKSDYANALILQNLARIALDQEQYKTAIKHLNSAHALKVLPALQQANIDRTLGQLYCLDSKWNACVRHTKRWMSAAPSQVKSADHVLMAQAYTQLSQWASVISHISVAIKSRKIAPESWYQLKVAAHARLKQWQRAARQQQVLVGFYADKPVHWRQLVGFQLQAKQSKAALASQRLGFERKILRTAKDYKLLFQLLVSEGAPYQAALVLEEGINKGVVNASVSNLRSLGQSWVAAKDYKKAIPVLTKVTHLEPKERNFAPLANLYVQEQQWQAAEEVVIRALKNEQYSARLQLILGITQLNLKEYKAARRAFEKAAKNDKYKKVVASWIEFLDQVNKTEHFNG